jgi:multimeric flavodoxin WrbA
MMNMKVIAINGGPRKTWNTATLLQKALDGAKAAGAETELIHLYDLNYKGCISCFACKRKNGLVGRCAVKDDLSEVLEKVNHCDVLLLGTPIYLSNITGETQSFIERLLFSNLSYDFNHPSVHEKRSSTGLIFTMNIPKKALQQFGYNDLFSRYQSQFERYGGSAEVLVCNDTYQFDDYSKYNASMFDEKHKAEVKEKQFPIDCQNAFDLGVRLAQK